MSRFSARWRCQLFRFFFFFQSFLSNFQDGDFSPFFVHRAASINIRYFMKYFDSSSLGNKCQNLYAYLIMISFALHNNMTTTRINSYFNSGSFSKVNLHLWKNPNKILCITNIKYHNFMQYTICNFISNNTNNIKYKW